MNNGMIGAIVALFFATTLFGVQPPNTTVRCRTCIDSALHIRFPSELDGLRMSSRTTYDFGDDYYNIRYDSDESLTGVGGRRLKLIVHKPDDGKVMADGVDENLLKFFESVGDEAEKFAEQSFKKYKRLDMLVEGRLRKKGLKYMWYSNTMKFQDRSKSHMSIIAMFSWRNRIIILSYVEPILTGKVEPCETLPEGFLKIADAIGKYCKENGLIPVFIPMDVRVDMKTARMAAGRAGGFVMSEPRAECIASVLSRSEIAIGSRLHFLIFALCLGVPFIPLLFDPKIDAFSYEIYSSPAVTVTGKHDPMSIKIKIEKFINVFDSSFLCHTNNQIFFCLSHPEAQDNSTGTPFHHNRRLHNAASNHAPLFVILMAFLFDQRCFFTFPETTAH